VSLVRLVPRPRADIPVDRLWLVFFGEAFGQPWWARFLAPGYRHVSACAWYDDQQRWVYFDPTRRGTAIMLYREDEFSGRFAHLLGSSALVLRVVARHGRTSTPFGWWCTGAVKALLGTGGSAVTPYALSRRLLRDGAEVVTPCVGEEAACSPPCQHDEPVHA
jgi:hypothetical protein